MNHNNKIALVCASSKGLGKASAEVLLENNAQVIITSSNPDNLQKTKSELEERFNKPVTAIQCNLKSKEETENLFNKIIEKFQTIHILVNNTPGPKLSSFANLTDDDFLQANQDLFSSRLRKLR
jgi:3-oxoacyl-[acyl-carrier protein] reductase